MNPESRKSLNTTTGNRHIATYEWGSVEARSLIFFPGAGTSGCLPFGLDSLEKYRLRLIGVDRPGLGESDHDPERQWSSFLQDGATLCKDLLSGPSAVIGYSMGGPFALMLAQRIGRPCILVASQDDIHYPTVYSGLPEPMAELARRAILDTTNLEAEISQSFSAGLMLSMIERFSLPQDLDFYRSEPFAAEFTNALEAGFRSGAAGYAKDLLMAFGHWPIAAEDITVPVTLIYGEFDASPTHSLDQGKTLARRIPNASRLLIPGAGAAALWTHSEFILDVAAKQVDK